VAVAESLQSNDSTIRAGEAVMFDVAKPVAVQLPLNLNWWFAVVTLVAN